MIVAARGPRHPGSVTAARPLGADSRLSAVTAGASR
jgi:hypothetical protein